MYALSQWIAALTAISCLGYVFWVVYIRRELFNPLLYVIYGMFHWVVIGEIGTLLLDESYYEPRVFFEDFSHLLATSTIFLSLVSALLGFYVTRPRGVPVRSWQRAPANSRLALSTLIIGGVSAFFLLRHFQIFTYDQAGFEYALWILPLTLPTIAAGVFGAYLLFRAAHEAVPGRRWLLYTCGIWPLFVIASSNVFVVFALFALVFWYVNRQGKSPRASRAVVAWLTLLAPLAIVIALAVKIVQRPDDLETTYTLAKLLTAETAQETLTRLLTLDIFNVEVYSLFLVIIERVQNPGDLTWGASYLPLFPLFKFIDPDIRGMGRQLAIDEGFWDTHVSFSAPPVLELYSNFWIFAPVAGYLLLGMAAGYLYRWYLRSAEEGSGVLYSFMLGWLFFMQRGDALNTILYPAYIVAVMLLMLRLSANGADSPGIKQTDPA